MNRDSFEHYLVRVIGAAALISVCVAAVSVAVNARPDGRGSRAYWNRRWNFCIEYPSGWKSYEPFDGSGVELSLSRNRASASLISVSALPAEPNEEEPSRLRTPLETIEWSLKEMASSGGFQDLEILEKSSRRFLGRPGAAVSFSYRDPQGVHWQSREIDFSKADVIYSVGLREHPSDAARVEPAFEQVAASLRLDCRPGR